VCVCVWVCGCVCVGVCVGVWVYVCVFALCAMTILMMMMMMMMYAFVLVRESQFGMSADLHTQLKQIRQHVPLSRLSAPASPVSSVPAQTPLARSVATLKALVGAFVKIEDLSGQWAATVYEFRPQDQPRLYLDSPPGACPFVKPVLHGSRSALARAAVSTDATEAPVTRIGHVLPRERRRVPAKLLHPGFCEICRCKFASLYLVRCPPCRSKHSSL
jgi:hypothetical protein